MSQITLNEIETWITILTRMLKAKGIASIDVGDVDFYWTINAGDQLDLSQTPEPAVGSLEDDLRELRKVSQGESMPTPVDLDRFAAVLRVISEKILFTVTPHPIRRHPSPGRGHRQSAGPSKATSSFRRKPESTPSKDVDAAICESGGASQAVSPWLRKLPQ